ncbi:MAG TPA: phage tail protein, partial [Myxococcales bacterium]|nr:phage tail protein [Myxococcales bacterium]
VAHTLQDQRANHPLAAYNFKVTVDGVAMRFAKVSGLQREHQTVTYRHGLSFLEGEQISKFHMERFVSVTLEQGTVQGQKVLHQWLERSQPGVMEVSLCDEKGVPVIAWSIARALPVKLTAPTFDAATNQVSIETLEIRAAGISIKHLS